MAASFFFYDLETTGFDPRQARIMQFAGQRTDAELKPVGEPVNVMIKLTPDVLPSPDAILVTGITPQQTLADGLTEAEFLKFFYEEVVKPDTTFVGFNSIRFDDEFMRFLHWRNFYDPYEWHWDKGCSRWDLLDVVRMTRALRPEGITWPFAPDGKPTNRLEFLTAVNKLDHYKAHDALSDVHATIAVAQLIRYKQPDLFDYLLKCRNKKGVAALVESAQPFVYTSGKYPSERLHTTVAIRLADHPQAGTALVYDLYHDPTPFLKLSVDELMERWKFNKDPEAPLRLPVKSLKYNRCPAIAPMGVIKDEATQERIGLTLDTVTKHRDILAKHQAEFAKKVLAARAKMDDLRDKEQVTLMDDESTVDERLYEGFLNDPDRKTIKRIPKSSPDELSEIAKSFKDDRLRSLMPLYKARNFPRALTGEERAAWEVFLKKKLLAGGNDSRLAKYFARLKELSGEKLTGEQKFLLEELQLYGESIVPTEA